MARLKQTDIRVGIKTSDDYLAQLIPHATDHYDGNASALFRDYARLGIALRTKFGDNFEQMMKTLVGNDYRRSIQP
jgi:hypothetical protein